MKTTYEKLFNFATLAQMWIGNGKDRDKTKLGYAILRMKPRWEKAQQKYQAVLEDINVDACAVDSNGVILTEPSGAFRFTKEGLKERNRKQRELREFEIEIEPYYATDVPEDLSTTEREAFEGFVVKVEAAAAAE